MAMSRLERDYRERQRKRRMFLAKLHAAREEYRNGTGGYANPGDTGDTGGFTYDWESPALGAWDSAAEGFDELVDGLPNPTMTVYAPSGNFTSKYLGCSSPGAATYVATYWPSDQADFLDGTIEAVMSIQSTANTQPMIIARTNPDDISDMINCRLNRNNLSFEIYENNTLKTTIGAQYVTNGNRAHVTLTLSGSTVTATAVSLDSEHSYEIGYTTTVAHSGKWGFRTVVAGSGQHQTFDDLNITPA